MKNSKTFVENLPLFMVITLPVLLALIGSSKACAGESSTNASFWDKIVWGTVTNGIRLGMNINSIKIGPEILPICDLFIENVGTNFLYLRVPGQNGRQSDLHGLDGHSVAKKPVSTNKGVRHKTLRPNSPSQLEFFSIPETFEVKTNGTYSLVVSYRVAASPDPVKIWGTSGDYFYLAPVTNSFNIIGLENSTKSKVINMNGTNQPLGRQ